MSIEHKLNGVTHDSVSAIDKLMAMCSISQEALKELGESHSESNLVLLADIHTASARVKQMMKSQANNPVAHQAGVWVSKISKDAKLESDEDLFNLLAADENVDDATKVQIQNYLMHAKSEYDTFVKAKELKKPDFDEKLRYWNELPGSVEPKKVKTIGNTEQTIYFKRWVPHTMKRVQHKNGQVTYEWKQKTDKDGKPITQEESFHEPKWDANPLAHRSVKARFQNYVSRLNPRFGTSFNYALMVVVDLILSDITEYGVRNSLAQFLANGVPSGHEVKLTLEPAVFESCPPRHTFVSMFPTLFGEHKLTADLSYISHFKKATEDAVENAAANELARYAEHLGKTEIKVTASQNFKIACANAVGLFLERVGQQLYCFVLGRQKKKTFNSGMLISQVLSNLMFANIDNYAKFDFNLDDNDEAWNAYTLKSLSQLQESGNLEALRKIPQLIRVFIVEKFIKAKEKEEEDAASEE